MLMGVALLGLGLVLTFGGGRALYRAWTSSRWPVTQGTVLDSSLETVREQRSVSYVPHVRYRYQVEGKLYTSNVLAFGAGGVEKRAKKEADEFLRRHASGTPVKVRYAPDEPELACIECDHAGVADYVLTVGGVALLLFATSGMLDLLRVEAQKRRRLQEAAAQGPRPPAPLL
jgi:hypothetical protein